MIKTISLAVITVGILLLFFGIDAYNAPNYGIFRFFAGSATDKSTWISVVGVVATDLGFLGLLQGSKRI